MRFPDEDAYDEAGAITRLWYRIICPFTHGARLWMVTTSILCALAVMHSANGSWGYHGSAQDTGFLSGNFVNGVRLAWQIDAADAGLDRIDDYVARDGRLFLVGYHGTQRIAIGYDASHSTPRELWRVDVDDEPGVHWWDGDLLVGNTLISPADGKVTTGWPSSSGLHLGVSPYEHASTEGWSTAPIGPVRFYCPDPATGLCEAWDKTATHVWDFDASIGSFPDSVTPVDGWVPLLGTLHGLDNAFYDTTDGISGFLNLTTGERTGVEPIKDACGPATTELDDGTTSCRITSPYIGAPPIIRAQDGWVISSGYMHVATVAPDGSNAQVVALTKEDITRIKYLRTYPQTEASLPTTEQIVQYAATGDHSWDTTISHTEDAAIIVNDSVTVDTHQGYLDSLFYDASWGWAAPAISRDASVLLIPHLKGASSNEQDLDSWRPSLINVSDAAHSSTLPETSSVYRLSNDAVPGWNDLGVRSATPLYDDLIVAHVSPASSPWYEHILALTPSPGDRVVGLTPTHKASRSVR